MVLYNVIRTKHNGKEGLTFKLVRPEGTEDYLFLHFKTPAKFDLFDKSYSLEAGTCILLSPKTPHAIYHHGCELVHDWMHFLPSDEEEFLNVGIDINTFFYPVDRDFITSAIKRCEIELINKEEMYKEAISSEVTNLFIKLKRQLKENVSGHHAKDFKELRADLYRNPDKYVNVSQMAEKVNLSRSRFSVLYNEIFGVSPQKDHISARISKASYLLSAGTLNLEEISEMCGYQNIYHFIRQFRDIMGITPGKYRDNH